MQNKEKLRSRISYSNGAAPEILNGFTGLYSTKSDIYSIGSMLHYLLTGQNYFSGQYSAKFISAEDYYNEIPLLRQINPSAASVIMKIFSQCSQGNPLKRCDDDTLIQMLKQLTLLTDSDSVYPEDCVIVSSSEAEMFADEFYNLRRMLSTRRPVIIQGLHGSRKTDFAKDYAADTHRLYHTVIWADYKGSLKNTIASVKFHGIDDNNYDTDRLYEIKYSHLQKHDNELLLIIDGYDTQDNDAENFFAGLGCHVLVTSSYNNSGIYPGNIYTMKKEQELIFDSDEKKSFQCRMSKLTSLNRTLRLIYTFLYIFGIITLLPFLAMYEFKSSSFGIPVIICVAATILLKSMIFGRAEKEAYFSLCRRYSSKYFREVYSLGQNENNHQTFELTEPDFIPAVEKKRHRFRLIIGASAIISGIITGLLSFKLMSFPFLMTSYMLILLIIFYADFCYSNYITHKTYREMFGGGSKNLDEIYSFISCTDNESYGNYINPGCAREIIYHSYKIYNNRFGTIDVISKMFGCFIVFTVLLECYQFMPWEYFRIPDFLPHNILLYFLIIIFFASSFLPIASCVGFYSKSKDMLFSAFIENKGFTNDKFSEYLNDGQISRLSYARGIYVYAMKQFENGIPIYEMRPAERPTFEQYCTTQNARTAVYFLLLLIAEISFFVWHMGIYQALCPIIVFNAAAMFIWYIWGVKKLNAYFLKIKSYEADK